MLRRSQKEHISSDFILVTTFQGYHSCELKFLSISNKTLSATYINECCLESKPYGRGPPRLAHFPLQVHRRLKKRHIEITSSSSVTPRSISRLTRYKGGWTGNRGGVGEGDSSGVGGELKVKGGQGTSLREITRDRSMGEAERGREGAVPWATTALPPHSHPCVTSPCCKLGYTCSLEMSQRIS